MGSSGNGPSTRTKIAIIAVSCVVVALTAYGLSRSSGTKNPTGTPDTSGTGIADATNTKGTNPVVPSAKPSTPGAGVTPGTGVTPGNGEREPAPYVPPKLTMGEPPSNTLVPVPAPAPAANTPPGPSGTPGSPQTNPATPGTGPIDPSANKPTPGTTPPGPSGPGPSPSGPTPPGSMPPGSTPPALAPAGPPVESNGASREVRDVVENANRAIAAGRAVEGRTLLNRALMSRDLPAGERSALRAQIAALNETLFFGSTVAAGDTLCDSYTIAAGDYLATIVSKQGIPVEWQLLQRINRVNPSALKIGQKIKIVRQPLHAIVHKNDYRMDVYAGDPLVAGSTGQTGPDGQDPSWTYIRSFKVGLGESDGTPEGAFVIKPKSKMVNPRWVNPRDPKMKFDGGDPKNPIGKHWLGLEGMDDATKKFTSYGIHGTIEPDSIGKQQSMGCVRMLPEDVAMVYEMLKDRISTVKIMK